MSEQEWDERYSATDRVWSGRPNEALITEAADLEPGSALDVGCGRAPTPSGWRSAGGGSRVWTCPGSRWRGPAGGTTRKTSRWSGSGPT